MDGLKADVGERLAVPLKDLSRDLARWVDENTQMPTRTERLGLWLSRCPAVRWRRTTSAGGKVTAHRHGPLTGLIVDVGRWLGP